MQKSIIIFLCFFSLNLFAQEEKAKRVYPFGKDNKWGIISSDRTVIAKPEYDSIGFFTDIDRPGNSAVVKKRDKLGARSPDAPSAGR